MALLSHVADSRPIVVCDGNSLTFGTGTSDATMAYPAQLERLLGRVNYSVVNVSVGGVTTQQMSAQAANVCDRLLNLPNSKKILCTWECTNDIALNHSDAATAYANWAAYCLARKNAGFTVLTFTVLPRNVPGFEATRLAVNVSVLANWATFAHGVVDVGGDPIIGSAANLGDTNIYADGTHLTAYGYSIVASLAQTAIGALP